MGPIFLAPAESLGGPYLLIDQKHDQITRTDISRKPLIWSSKFIFKQEHIFRARCMVHSGIKHLLKKVNQINMFGHLDKWNSNGS